MATANGPGVEEPPRQKSVKEQRLERRRAARLEAIRQRTNHKRTLIEFQPDAVEIEKRSVPGGARWTLYTVVGLLIFAVWWSWWAQVDRIVIANGKLVTVSNPFIVQSVQTAPIRKLNFKFGDRVKAGEVMATLDPTFPEADLATLHAKLSGFEASLHRLKAERDSLEFTKEESESNVDMAMEYQFWLERKQEYEAKMNEFISEKTKLDVQVENNTDNIAMSQDAVEIHRDVLQKYRELYRKSAKSEIEVNSQRLKTQQAVAELAKAKSLSRELSAEYIALEKRKEAFVANWRARVAAELLQKYQERKELLEEIKKAEQSNSYVKLTAPSDTDFEEFEVLEMADVSHGSVLRSGDPLYKLIPVNAPLEAEIEILGKDIARVTEGIEVQVKLAAFPYQEHGTLKGKIRTISEDAFEKETELGPQISYKARVEFEHPMKLENMGDSSISAGMTSVAEVKVGKRRVIQYFLYPIIRAWDEGLREP